MQRLFLTSLGVIYLIAFASFGYQAPGLIGPGGILPAGVFLSRVAAEYGPPSYFALPTVFWLGASDLALRLAALSGALAALALIAGYLQRPALLACYLLYLSIASAGQDFLSFQWDALLLETGFLAIFLGLAREIVWMFRWLLFRLMLLSGAVKLMSHDPVWHNLTALEYHYQTQPLPTPLAWYIHQAPPWFQTSSCAIMFAIELGAPFLIFLPRRFRLLAAALFVSLQVLILLTGNYTFFNLLAIALCLFLLNDTARSPTAAARSGWRVILARAVAVLLLVVTTGQLLHQFTGYAFPPYAALQRLAGPFEIANTYGLFAVMTTTRHEIVVERSDDGQTWREYEFPYKPGDLRRAPPWVAPYQPRLDWQMWFAALGSYQQNPWFVNFVFRLLQGSPAVLRLLGQTRPEQPPKYVRAQLYEYTFTDFKTRRETGRWWNREWKAIYFPSVSLADFRLSSR